MRRGDGEANLTSVCDARSGNQPFILLSRMSHYGESKMTSNWQVHDQHAGPLGSLPLI